MKFTYYILIVEDSHGNKCAGVVEEMCDTIQISGLKHGNGNPAFFESDAYHLLTWCEDNSFSYTERKKEEAV